ncbi:hypothetical protein BYT27DRAFT_7336708 [Phlegmacium glaucopus]|nr:hypothetical protein BYT27DRAFT_7336708 [Phlegmacium glaucopus]
MASTTALRLEYSAFFSSGLLAQHTPQKKVNSSSFKWDDSADIMFDRSPSRPSSPIPIPDESLMDIDMANYSSCDDRRSTTPTPQTITPMQSPQPVKIQSKPQTQQQQPTQPRLRKRRSSLTQATSPMNAIRSPTRTASNAIHLQRQLSTVVAPRSRSGSIAGEDVTTSRYSNVGVASSATSLEGRMRSGSLGCAPAPPSATGMRRHPIRRLHISALQAPLTPPPTAPLPALPPIHPDQQHFRPTNLNTPTYPLSTRTPHTKASSFSTSSVSMTSARARGLSVSSSALDGDENRIDEDMKEN